MTTRSPRVGWIISLIRSGSSATAYGAASAWSHPIADEALGPWVRIGQKYAFPPVQRDLVRAFKEARWTLSEQVVTLANQLFDELGGPTGGVVVKHPHLDFHPDDFRAAFPDHGVVYLIRNPLHRLNSIYARGLLESLRPNHELEHFTEFAKRWLTRPDAQRVVFDDLKQDPRDYYRRIFDAWGWKYEAADLDTAASYTASNYHSSCKELEGTDPDRPMSESAARLPLEAIDLYLSDPFIVDLMTQLGWSTDGESYLPLVGAMT